MDSRNRFESVAFDYEGVACMMAARPEYASAPVPAETLAELGQTLYNTAYVSPKIKGIVSAACKGGANIDDLLNRAWAAAIAGGALRAHEGKIVFPLPVMCDDGETPVEVTIARNDRVAGGFPWCVSYVNTTAHAVSAGVAASSVTLQEFAYLGYWDSFLEELASLALPESWDFEEVSARESGGADVSREVLAAGFPGVAASHFTVPRFDGADAAGSRADGADAAGSRADGADAAGLRADGTDAVELRAAGRRRYPILKSYITNYFYRLQREDKICIARDESFAACNSGLVDRRYDDIYLCFEPNVPDARSPWRFAGFCTRGVGRLGKRLVGLFNPLPQTATFFDRKEDLLFDVDAELVINYDHVLTDNIHRLPIDFIKEGMRTDDTALALLDEIRTAPEARRTVLYDEVRERLEADHVAFRYLRTRLDGAVELARKRVRWNYKTAIPMYYPRANTMSLLLPLCLMDEGVADAALVVELMDSGNYQGQTVLTMRMAYQDARLVCRPDSDWLTTAARGEREADE